MANWAIVIGIDAAAYGSGGGPAPPGAVADAAAMADWLTRPDGGGVPERNLVCRFGEVGQPPGATYGHVVTAIEDVVDRAGGHGERLFVHFAGQALTTRHGRDVLCLQDFTPTRTRCSLDLDALVAVFAATGFLEQFWLVDGARGGPGGPAELEVGRPPRLPYHDHDGRRPTQYVCWATAAVPSAGSSTPLTPTLLAGLAGDGAAKRWDEARRRYVVRWGALTAQLRARSRVDAPDEPDGPGADALLATLDPAGVPPPGPSLGRRTRDRA